MNFRQNWTLSRFWKYSIYNFLLYLISCGFFVYSVIDHYWRIAKTDDTKVSFGLFRYCKTVSQLNEAGGQTSTSQCKEFLHFFTWEIIVLSLICTQIAGIILAIIPLSRILAKPILVSIIAIFSFMFSVVVIILEIVNKNDLNHKSLKEIKNIANVQMGRTFFVYCVGSFFGFLAALLGVVLFSIQWQIQLNPSTIRIVDSHSEPSPIRVIGTNNYRVPPSAPSPDAWSESSTAIHY